MRTLTKYGLLLLWIIGCTGIVFGTDGLVLNEMMAMNNATIADEHGEYDDWIEIVNTSSESIDLFGLNLTDNLSNPQAFTFPDITLGSGEYLLIWTDDDIEQGDLHAGFKLSSGGESVYLLDGGVILDDTIFGTLGADLSWGRWPDGTGEWKIMNRATPGTENDDTAQSVYEIVLNEIMADNFSVIEDPDEPGEFPDWIELYNLETEAVDLGGMYLSDDPNDPTKYAIPAGVVIPAQGYLVFWADNETDQGNLHTNFKLGSGGETVTLFQGSQLVDSTEYIDMGTDLSWGRWPDGTGEWKILSEATPGDSNVDPDIPDVNLCINEFMADNTTVIEDPDEPGEYPDWIEIYNAELDPVDMSGMFLTDDPVDPTKYPIPDGVTIPAGGYLVFWADDEDEQGPYHTNFKLSKSNEVVYLYSIDGETLVDGLSYGEQTVNVSRGRYPDGTDNWGFMTTPSPGSANVQSTGTGMDLMLDDAQLSAGDTFHLHFIVWPESSALDVDVYILLDVYNQYWSWPNWDDLSSGLGFVSYTVSPDTPINVDVFDFVWPDLGGSAASGLFFYGVAMQRGTFDMIGEMEINEFSYQ